MNELPFERGTYTCAAGALGDVFYDPTNKQRVQVMKNTYTAALSAKRVVKWETPETYEVDLATTFAHGPMVAGVVDPKLGSATVPVNGYFFGVVEGVVTASMGSGTDVAAAGELLIVASGAAAAGYGKLCAMTAVSGAVGLLTAELTEQRYVVAVCHDVVSCDATNDAQVRLALRR